MDLQILVGFTLSVSISRGQCVSLLHLSLTSLKQTCLWGCEITPAAQMKTSPSVLWQSSVYLFCLPLYHTPVLTALLNVEQSNGSSVFQPDMPNKQTAIVMMVTPLKWDSVPNWTTLLLLLLKQLIRCPPLMQTTCYN